MTHTEQDLGKLRLGDYARCREGIRYAMYLAPESPEPHNLMGLLLQRQGEYVKAMKHFRAALDLDPTFAPARKNLMAHSGPDMQDHTLCFRPKNE